MSMKEARRSVTDQDIQKCVEVFAHPPTPPWPCFSPSPLHCAITRYGAFAATMQQARAQITAGGTSLGNFAFPTSGGGAQNGNGNGPAAPPQEDDLYA
jgi:hypothetical protein